MNYIELKNVTKSFGSRKAIDNVSLEIEEASFVVLLGASGCGKSTLLRLIAGLEPASDGEIWLHGKPAKGLPPHRRDCSFAFQCGVCYEHWTAQKNIRESATGTDEAIVQHVVRALGIDACMPQYPSQLSGGELQRLSLARSLVSSKRILLLDEPLAQLHPKIRFEARELIRHIHDQCHKTTVFVTHDLPEALALADQIIVLDNGRMVAHGKPRECFDPPTNEHCAALMGIFNPAIGPFKNPIPHHWKIYSIGGQDFRSNSKSDTKDDKVIDGHIVGCRWLGSHWELRVMPHPKPVLRSECNLSQNASLTDVVLANVPDGPWISRELALLLRSLENQHVVQDGKLSGPIVRMTSMVRSGVD